MEVTCGSFILLLWFFGERQMWWRSREYHVKWFILRGEMHLSAVSVCKCVFEEIKLSIVIKDVVPQG